MRNIHRYFGMFQKIVYISAEVMSNKPKVARSCEELRGVAGAVARNEAKRSNTKQSKAKQS